MDKDKLENQIRHYADQNRVELPDDLLWDQIGETLIPEKKDKVTLPLILLPILLVSALSGFFQDSKPTSTQFKQEKIITDSKPEKTNHDISSTALKVQENKISVNTEFENINTKSSFVTQADDYHKMSATDQPPKRERINEANHPVSKASLGGFPEERPIEVLPLNVQFLTAEVTPLPQFTCAVDFISSKDEVKPWLAPQFPVQRQLGVFAGTVMVQNLLPKSYAKFEYPFPSIELGVSYRSSLKNNFFIEGQFIFQRVETRFRYQGVYEASEFRQNALIERYEIDGQIYEVRKDTNVTVNVERNVQNYNRINLIQVPLSLGYSYKFKNHTFSAITGLNISLVTLQKGLWVDAQGRVNNFNLQTPLYKSSTNLGLHGGLEYALQYRENIQYFTGFNFSKGVTDWSDGLGVQPLSYGLRLGIRWKL